MSDLLQQRLDKLSRLRELGLDPYPQPNLVDKNTCEQALGLLDKSVTVAGRLMSLRGHGKIVFGDLHDRSGKIQLFFEEKTLVDKQELTKLLDLGDIISVSGIVFKTQAGEVTIRVSEFHILSKNIRPLPEKWHGLKDIEERYRQRYVDLIVNPEARDVLITRSKVLTAMRKFFDEHGFLEVETPILQPLYGGASAKPFITHHNVLDMDMYLRISDELYLKRLIVGGLEKVYEVSKDFRNEGVSRFHNPEFTQIEFYWAYVDYEVLMKFTEELVSGIVKLVKGSYQLTYQGTTLDFTPPFKRVTFRDVILGKTGIDIDLTKTEVDFENLVKDKGLKVDFSEAVGIGACFDALYKEYVRPFVGVDKPTFMMDYPAEMIALAKRKVDRPDRIASFQLLACGAELLKAYNELNDPKDQADRWLEEEALSKKGLETAMQFDHDYIRALEYGMPPTSGWGMGIDRFCQFLTDQPTIKDVIYFPAMRPEVESNTTIGLENPKIIIGQVVAIKDHPNADKLKLFDVKVSNQETLTLVSGCINVKVGNIVPVALIDSIVFAPENKTQKIKVSKMRGIESPGMMCSPLEIGLGTDHTGIYLLPEKLVKFIGQPVSRHLSKTLLPRP